MVNKNNKDNKGISPVVATALLLVVAVVAVVGFQTWFNTYQSGLNAKVEQQSDTGSSITVERIEISGSDALVYIKNSGTSAVNNAQIEITNDGATPSGSCVNATNSYTIPASTVTNFVINGTNCAFTAGNIAEILIVTGDGTFSEEEIIR